MNRRNIFALAGGAILAALGIKKASAYSETSAWENSENLRAEMTTVVCSSLSTRLGREVFPQCRTRGEVQLVIGNRRISRAAFDQAKQSLEDQIEYWRSCVDESLG